MSINFKKNIKSNYRNLMINTSLITLSYPQSLKRLQTSQTANMSDQSHASIQSKDLTASSILFTHRTTQYIPGNLMKVKLAR